MEKSKIEMLLESNKYSALQAKDNVVMKLLLENTEAEIARLVNENTLAGDIAQFTPIMMPLVRRVYPQLIANEILGVQPMTMPTGFIYALTNQYIGTGINNANPNSKAVIVKTAAAHGLAEGDTLGSGKVLFVQDDLVLTDATIAVGDTVGTSTAAGIFTNEASFGRILKNYTGKYSTAQAEQLAKDRKEIGFSIAKKSVAVESRAESRSFLISSKHSATP